MFDRDYWNEIWLTLSRNRIRSLLTCFGVFWGMLILIILLGLCEGVRNGINLNVKGIATNSCFFVTNITSEPFEGFNRGRSWNMHNADIENIINEIKGVEYISPILINYRGEKNIKYNSLSGSFLVKGIYSEYFNIEKTTLVKGRLINYIDNKNKRKVCVIGSTVRDIFFRKHENYIGEYLNVEGIYYQIVGVIEAKSSINIAGNPNESIIIPFHTMQQIRGGGDGFKHLCVSVKEGYSSENVFANIKTLLKKQNKISINDKQAIKEVNIAKEFERFNSIYISVNILTWIVGLGTLLAGIIGINNIMLVTVKERTQEIGIRRALGAKPMDIVLQILSESVIMSTFSGVFGLIIGVNILFFIDFILSVSPVESAILVHPIINFNVAVYIVIFLMICGNLSGLLPAIRALTIKPIEAIQSE